MNPDQTVSYLIANTTVGSRVPLDIIRGGRRMTITVTVGQRPSEEETRIGGDEANLLAAAPGVDRLRISAYAKDIRTAYDYQYKLQNAQDIQKVESCRTSKRQNGYGVDAILRMFPVTQ